MNTHALERIKLNTLQFEHLRRLPILKIWSKDVNTRVICRVFYCHFIATIACIDISLFVEKVLTTANNSKVNFLRFSICQT